MDLQQGIAAVQSACARTAARRRRSRFSDIAMPLGSLGLLQDAVAQTAGHPAHGAPLDWPSARL